MNFEDIQAVKKLLSEPQKIVIVPHKNPDGDAIGSTLALWHYLKYRGHEATVIVPNDYPKFLKWMSGNDQILNFERENSQAKSKIETATVIFTLDFNHLGRIEMVEIQRKDYSGGFDLGLGLRVFPFKIKDLVVAGHPF